MKASANRLSPRTNASTTHHNRRGFMKKLKAIKHVRLLVLLLALSVITMGYSAIMVRHAGASPQAAPVRQSELVGPVTVTATAGTTGPTDYTTLGAAFAAINAGTHQGAITIDIVASTTETAANVLNGSGAGAASYTSVLIRPANDGVTIAGPTVTGRGLIELNGADNVTIDGDNPNSAGTNRNLTIQNTAVSTITYAQVIRIALAATLVTSADNNTIKNLNLLGHATGRNAAANTSTTGTENASYGVLATGGASTTDATAAPAAIASVTTVIGAGATATNLTIQNNNITTCARAVAIQGSAATVFPGLLIENNSIGNATAGAADQVYSMGVTAQGTNNAIIRGNTVYVESYVGTANRGLEFGSISATGTTALFEKNKVLRVRNNNGGTFGAYGINLGGGNTHTLQNNFVVDVRNDQTAGTGAFSTTFGAFGVRVAAGTGHKVYHNSVHLFGVLPGATNTDLTVAFGIVNTAQTGMDVRNNIFSNQLTGGNQTGTNTRHAVLFLPSGGTSAMNLTINNNAYYQGPNTTGALSLLAQVGTTGGTGEYLAANFNPAATTPATNLRAYTSTLSAAGTNDNASFATSSPPPFTSNTDLHIPNGTVTRLESGGAAVGVTVDIDNETRNATTPDIGADEFAGTLPPANDIAATAIVVPANGGAVFNGSTVTPQASFSNVGTATQSGVMVQFTITGPGGYTYTDTQTIATITPGQTVTVTFAAAPAFTMTGSYTTTATVLTADANGANNTVTGNFTVNPVITGGAVNVGTGETYTSLTNPGGVFAAINAATVTSNITVNITSNLTGETGAVALNEIPGGFTVLIKPSGAARTVSGTSATSMIPFNGTDGVTIDGSLAAGTDRSLTVTNAGGGGGIGFTTGTNGAQGNTVKNVNVFGGSATATIIGISFGGNTFGSAGADNDNNRVENCDLRSSIYGIYSVGASAANKNTGLVITGNQMTQTGAARIGRIGIFIGFDDGAQITLNNINGINSAENADAIAIGVGTQGIGTTTPTPVDVTNVLVSRNNIGIVQQTNTFSAAGIALASGTSGTNTIVNNMVSGVIANSNAGDFVAGIYVLGIAGATQNVYHNSVSMTGARGATATQYGSFALALAGADVPVNVKDNILFNSQTQTGGGAGGRSYAIGTASTTFANLDSNYNDLFVSGAQATLGITGGLLNVAGTGTGTDRADLAAWQAATGKDANSISADPLFTSTTDLHLLTGSPAINAGTNVGVTIDIDGQARDAMPDMGADEFGSPSPGTLALSSATYTVGEAAGTVTITVNRTGGTDNAVSVNYALTNGTATGGATCAAGVDFINTGGTVNFTAGQASNTFTVAICNDAVFEGNETFNVTLSGATGGATVGAQASAVVTIVDDEVAQSGVLQLSSATYTVGEAAGTVTITVNRTGGTDGAVAVNYALTDGTATGGAACTAGVDYINTGGTVNFTNGQASNTFTVAICNDTLNEANETFNVTLSGATGGATVGAQASAVVTITDDDAVPSIAITSPSPLPEGNSGTTSFTFNVNLSAASGQTVTVHYSTADGTATAPSDYTAIPDTVLTFTPGQTNKQITVLVNGDTNVEPDENFFVNLSMPVNATISNAQGTGTIQNDDAVSGSVSINDVRTQEGNSGSHTVTFTATLTTASTPPNNASVQYSTGGGTATPGASPPADYQAASGTLNFGPPTDADRGADGGTDGGPITTTRTFTVTIFGDTNKEANETFFVNLSNPVGITVADGQGVGIIVDEDRAYVSDFDRDLKSDLSVFRPSIGSAGDDPNDSYWFVSQSTNGVVKYEHFGTNGDLPVPGDYDGDGKADYAVFRPSNATWYIEQSSNFQLVAYQWGISTDKPVQNDYDGDGKTDVAVFRDGAWYVLRSSDQTAQVVLFGTTDDKPVSGDFDGDFKTDFAVFRAGIWYVLRSSDNGVVSQPWGIASDKPVIGDFDGDGRVDFTVFRQGTWYILQSLTGTSIAVQWGTSGDIPVAGDYDADGTSDIAVWRPSQGDWYIIASGNPATQLLPPSQLSQHFGQSGDKPVPAAYVPEQFTGGGPER